MKRRNLLFTELTAHGYRVRRLSPKGELKDALDETTVLTPAFVLDDETDTLFFATHLNDRTSIRRVAEGGVISVVFWDIPTRYGGVLSWDVLALALAPGGTLYAADPKYGRVVQITPDGEAAIAVDRDSFNSQQFRPVATLITPDGDLLVADSGMSVIWKITLSDDAGAPARDVEALFDQVVDSLRRVPTPETGGE